MITIKTNEEIEILRECGKRLAVMLSTLAAKVAPGVTTAELDTLARELAKKGGDKPSFLDYKPYGAKRAYPAAICVSVNDEVVHGIPNESEKILKEGDIVSIDGGLIHKGMITDGAITVPVGKIDAQAEKLLQVTQEALMRGIAAANSGNTVGDIGYAIEQYVKPHGFGIVQELCGHGVGYKVHEDPFVPNYGKKGEGVKLRPGMVIAIEPMLNEGGREIKLDKDGYTYKTVDGKRSAHFEHTIVITENGPEIVTKA
jgi:methionyl aminopeptidase